MDQHSPEDARRALASAVMDGQADPAQTRAWLDHATSDEAARADWHLYHLIGDVMRSEELSSTAEHDAALLHRVREGVRQEPVVLAPRALEAAVPPAAPHRQRRTRTRVWAATAAAAAGFLVVGAAFLGTRVEDEVVSSLAVNSRGSVTQDLQRTSVGAAAPIAPWASPVELGASVSNFREILRLPRGPADRPQQAVQILYSNGSATISVLIEPYRPDEHRPRAEEGERLNTLSLHRHGAWLTLSGDVPLGTLHQVAAAVEPSP